MCVNRRRNRPLWANFLSLIVLISSSPEIITAQASIASGTTIRAERSDLSSADPSERPAATTLVVSVLPKYYDRQVGMSLAELVNRSLMENGELVAARLEIEKARARLTQARLRPNPTLELEQTSGRFTGSPGDGDLSVGATLPLEVFGQRSSRVKLAQIEIRAREVDIANRERQLTADVLTNFADALAAMQGLKVTESLLDLDLQTTRFVQIGVNEGETPPLALSLLQVEVERLRANQALSEGKLEAALTKLKLLAGTPFEEPLRLREQISTMVLPPIPPTVETAIELALKSRPDIRIAQIEEELAAAGLRLIRVTSKPDVAVTSRYTQGISQIPIPNFGDVPDRTRTLTFGISVGLPIFNKNQGAKAEAAIAIRQAQERRIFAERIVRAEVTGAFQRLQAAQRALAILQTNVLPRSEQNIKTLRAVYELGEIKITDLIAEQRRLLDANRDLTEALTERFHAQADLQIAVGVPFVK